MTATVTAAFPIGSRVTQTLQGHLSYIGRIPDPSVDRLSGTVIGHQGLSIHIRWDDSFNGHDPDGREPLPGDSTHDGHCWYLYANEIMIDDTVTRTVDTVDTTVDSNSHPIIPRAKVTITRSTDTYDNPWRLTINNGPMVTKYEMIDYLDKTVIRRLGRRVWNQDLQTIIDRGIQTYGIDPQVFVAAITSAVIAKQARESHGLYTNSTFDVDTQLAITNQPMLVAIGDQMFSLQPRGVIDGSRALKVMRDRLKQAARVNAEHIKRAAKAEADGMIANGERQLAAARAKIESEMAALRNVMTIPQWVADNRLMVMKEDDDSYPLAIGINIDTAIKSFQLTRYVSEGIAEVCRWHNILLLARYHQVTVWMPFNPSTGQYKYNGTDDGCRVIGDSTKVDLLPHIGRGGCCMTLQGMIPEMRDYDHYRTIVKAINRGNMEVNLNSLLTGYNHWHRDIQDQTPKNVKKIMDEGWHRSTQPGLITDNLVADAERTPVVTEARETFTLESLREARLARGEELPALDIMDNIDESILGDPLLIEDREEAGDNV